MPNVLTLGITEIELLLDGDRFLGIGKVWIDSVLIRSGRLPWRIMTQTYSGMELAELRVLGINSRDEELHIRLDARFSPLFTHLKQDHSTDPIHDTGDWQDEAPVSGGEMTLVLSKAALEIHEARFTGFSFHWHYRSDSVPLFFLYDMSSWELDGDITGATAISQSSCSDPVVIFAPDTQWTTEGLIHWVDEASKANPVMTHNLPRWASHQAFDYQYKGAHTLLGCWENVGLIRSLLRRDAHKAELKVFDKYIFDETLEFTTPSKCILLHSSGLSEIGQQNLWTWTMDLLHDRARAEFDLREEPVLPRLAVNYWHNFTIDSYYRDLLPAAAACGFKALFLDNLNKSNMTEGYRFGTMCCQHEVEVAPQLGGKRR